MIDRILFRNLLDEGERIVYVAHVHPFIVYPTLFKIFFAGVLLPAFGYGLFPLMPAVWAAWGILGMTLLLYRLLQWYMDAWIITTMAVINLEWNSPFDQTTNRIEYGNIESITNETKGFWATILRFGQIRIDYVASNPIVLANVASPKKIERLIMEHQSQFVEKQTMDDHAKLKELLTSLVRSSKQ